MTPHATMSGLYLFRVDRHAEPGQAAYFVDGETVSAGGIGNRRVGTFSVMPVSDTDAIGTGIPPEFLRWVGVNG